MNKKNKAFALFNQGFRPGDQEVKALGLKPKTSYNYFQLWKQSSIMAAPDNGAEQPEDSEQNICNSEVLAVRMVMGYSF